MCVGGIKHSEQRFNSRSAGVSSALLFISIGGKDGVLFFFLYQLSLALLNMIIVLHMVHRCVCTHSLLEDLW